MKISRLRLSAMAGSLIAIVFAVEPSFAAGALAVGRCSYGYSFGLKTMAEARGLALSECNSASCKIIGTFRRQCLAYAHEFGKPCGIYGWAVRNRLNLAKEAARKFCREEGGTFCIVETAVCDTKG